MNGKRFGHQRPRECLKIKNSQAESCEFEPRRPLHISVFVKMDVERAYGYV